MSNQHLFDLDLGQRRNLVEVQAIQRMLQELGGGYRSHIDPDMIERVQNTNLLEERPARTSAYAAHSAIAQTIFTTVTEDRESRFIALLGGLGSGKSTIVHHIERLANARPVQNDRDAPAGGETELESPPVESPIESPPIESPPVEPLPAGSPPVVPLPQGPDSSDSSDALPQQHPGEVFVFTYDAWSHGGESTRRSFIQELTGWLRKHEKRLFQDTNIRKKQRDRWKKSERRIVRRSTDTRTWASTSLTSFGVFFTFLTLLIPTLWRAFFVLSAREDISVDALLRDAPFVFGAAVSLIGLLLIAIHKLQDSKSSRPVSDEDDLLDVEPEHQSLTLIDRNTRTRSIASADRQTPSSFDVRTSVEELVSGVLDSDKDRRFVIVIDNIDRLTNAEEVKPVLALIQILFDIRRQASSASDWRHRFWVIAPFSEAVLFQAMGEDAKRGLPRYLLDKAFQVQVPIPLPLYTKWRNHLQAELRKAFDGCRRAPAGSTRISDEDLDLVEEIVAQHAPKDTAGPRDQMSTRSEQGINQGITRRPRDIKRFINDLVIQYRMRGTRTFPLPVLAYYTVRMIEMDGTSVVSEEIDRSDLEEPASTIQITTVELEDYIYALDYGVPVDDVYEYRLAKQLTEAFEEGRKNIEKGARIAQNAIDRYKRGRTDTHEIGILLRDATRSILARPSLPLLVEYGCVIQALTDIDTIRDSLLDRIDDVLCDRTTLSLDEGVSTKLARYINNRPHDVQQELCESILSKLSEVEVSTDVPVWQQWASFATHFLNQLDTNFDELARALNVPGDPETYCHILCSIIEDYQPTSDRMPRLDAGAFAPKDFDYNDSEVQREIESLVSPAFSDSTSDKSALTLVPAAVHIVEMYEGQEGTGWTWGEVLRSAFRFLGDESPAPSSCAECVAALIAKRISDPAYMRRHNEASVRLLVQVLVDEYPDLSNRIYAGATLFLALRNHEILDGDFPAGQPANSEFRTRMSRSPSQDREPIRELANLLSIQPSDIGSNYVEIKEYINNHERD